MTTFRFAEFDSGVRTGTVSEVEAPSLVAALLQLGGLELIDETTGSLLIADYGDFTGTVTFDDIEYRLESRSD
jgi:hypothetical protein